MAANRIHANLTLVNEHRVSNKSATGSIAPRLCFRRYIADCAERGLRSIYDSVTEASLHTLRRANGTTSCRLSDAAVTLQ